MVERTNVETRGDSLFWITIIFPAIAWLLYIGAVSHKLRSSKFGKEDFLLAAAVILLTAQTAVVFKGVQYGFGKHASDLQPEDLKTALKYFYVMQVLYKPLGGLVKLAFLCLYHRVFERPRFRTFVKWFMLYVSMGTIAFTVSSIFQCVPVSYNWDRRQKGHCISKGAYWYSHASWHVTSDFVVFLMPVPIILQLNMLKSRKISLVIVFVLGLFTCIASAIRMSTLLSSSKSKEPTWGSYDGMQWTQVDSCFSIICACLPILRKPISDIMHRLGFQQTTRDDNSCPLDDIPSSTNKSRLRTVWDPVKKTWYEERGGPERRVVGEHHRASLGSESALGIIRTTNVEIMRHSLDGSGKDSNDSRSVTDKELERRAAVYMV